MSVYSYGGRYRTPSFSYAPSYAPSYATSYAPSYATSGYSAYTDGSYYSQQLPSGQVSERMYFNLNGKLIRSYKIRNYRVCLSVFARRVAMLTFNRGYRMHRNTSSTSIQRHCRVSHPPASNFT